MHYREKETKMKKLLLVVLAGVFSLGATSVFAQTKPETLQEKIVRLEIENASLRAQIISLTNAQSQAQEKTLKPYYASMKIQQLCEEFDAIEGLGPDQDFKIDTYMKKQYMKGQGIEVSNAEMQISPTTSSVFTGSRSRRVYKITLTIMKRGGKTAHLKTYEKWVYDNLNRR